MAKGYEKYKQRVGHTSGVMSTRLPKPNVCRIEVMDSAARRAYMGGFQGVIDAFREQMQDALALSSGYNLYEPFYGILNNQSSGRGPSFDVTANWAENGGNKSGFNRMSQILTGNGGTSGLLGVLPGLNGPVHSVLNTIEHVANAGMELSGVNNSCTGSMTIKRFNGAKIDANLPLKFQWYLPEQEDMCRISLKRLVMMTYVRPMDMDGYQIVNAMIDGLLASGKQLYPVYEKAKNWVTDAFKQGDEFGRETTGVGYKEAGSMVGGFASDTGQYVADTYRDTLDFYGGEGTAKENGKFWGDVYKDGKTTLQNAGAKEAGVSFVNDLGHAVKGIVSEGVNAYNSINTYFGGEITANPLPVRVSIGHYFDLEPMVITKLSISSSNEQFVSKDGTHLPVFMYADVNLSYWMQPGPTKDFISILGNEVFSEYVKPGVKTEPNKIGNNPNKGKKR